MNFKSNEKAAIVRLLSLMSISDGSVDPREIGMTQLFMKRLGATNSDVAASARMSDSQACSIAKGMSLEKKRIASALLVELMVSDNEVERSEVAVLVGICAKCEFPMFSLFEARAVLTEYF